MRDLRRGARAPVLSLPLTALPRNEFHLRNCHAMCAACNRRHNSDRGPYLDFILKRYRPGVVAELDGLRVSLRKVTDEELRRKFEQFKSMA